LTRARHVAARLVTHPEESLLRTIAGEIRHAAVRTTVGTGVAHHRGARAFLRGLRLLLGHPALSPLRTLREYQIGSDNPAGGTRSVRCVTVRRRLYGEPESCPSVILVAERNRSVNVVGFGGNGLLNRRGPLPLRPLPRGVAVVLSGAMPRHGDSVEGLSFCDFVDDALFHPRWGYYSTGTVRFGTGGHYDTYPLALSPLFGAMVAQYAFRTWRRAGTPAGFEICERGPGNGPLGLDPLLRVPERARHDRAWKAFCNRLRYRILERARALVTRQRQQLGPLAESVVWSHADPARRLPHGVPFGAHGVIFANEGFDCLPHHKLMPQRNGEPAAAFVMPRLAGRNLDRRRLAAAMSSATRRRRVRFREVPVPIGRVPRLAAFVRRHHPDLLAGNGTRLAPYFACSRLPMLLGNTARFYRHADALWIDYGEQREFHRRTQESQRLFAGVPRSGAHIFDDPGRHDITFMVDFSAVMSTAREAGWWGG